MPIDYKEYHPKWKLISRLIRFVRAKNKCEECGRVNYVVNRMNRIDGSYEVFNYECDQLNPKDALKLCAALNSRVDGEGKWNVVILTVAHLDHDKTNNRFWNLKALCQRCHLRIDINHHVFNRKYGRKTKHLNGKLF